MSSDDGLKIICEVPLVREMVAFSKDIVLLTEDGVKVLKRGTVVDLPVPDFDKMTVRQEQPTKGSS